MLTTDRFRSLFFLVAGIVLLVVAAILTYQQLDFLKHATTAPGKVTHLNAGGSHPEIEFRDADGNLHSYPQGGFIAGYEVGSTVNVFYHPEFPKKSATIDDFGAIWAFPLFAGVLGCTFAFGALLNLFRKH